MLPSSARPRSSGESFPLSRREVWLIVGFWLALALLQLVNEVTGWSSARDSWRDALPVVGLAGCWVLVTVVVITVVERAARTGSSRWRQIALCAGLGVVTALGVGAADHAFRRAVPRDPRTASRIEPELFGLPPVGLPPDGPPSDAPAGAGDHRWFGGWRDFANALVLFVGVVAAAQARQYLLRYRQGREHAAELEARLLGAQLETLRRQLDPHFLFNTLSLITSLVERDPRGARRMIARLSDLLRFSLGSADAAEIPLSQEMAGVELYLDIMRVRFEGRVEVEVRSDPRLTNALVPPLLLQPLVENAFKHGVEQRRGPARVTIDAMLENGTVVIRVCDDGVGLRATAPDGDGRGGVGLTTTVARLRQLYGDAASLTLRPREGSGTEAEVRLPVHTDPALATARMTALYA